MCPLKSIRLILAILFLTTIESNAKIALNELKGFSTCMNPTYMYLAPALGALYETYAKNLTLIGNQASEAVIFVHELSLTSLDNKNSSTKIGRYLEPVDIGTIIGLVALHKNNSIDEQAMVKKIEAALKKIIIRKQYEIKKTITKELEHIITQDNKQYKEVEKALTKLYAKKDRADIKNALLTVAANWSKNSENVVINKLNNQAERALFAQLKELHRKLRCNRTLLDLEQRTLTVASPKLKDSMGAFAHALGGAITEEKNLYLHNNTTNLLLAFLWHKAKTTDEIIEALHAMAIAMTIDPEKFYAWHNQDPYTKADYEHLKTKTTAEIATLPLEDIVFARLAYPSHGNKLNIYAKAYFQSFVEQVQSTTDQNQKAILNSLIASWAPKWVDVNNRDPKIIYCRFLMQPMHTIPDKIALLKDLCMGKITITGMAKYYLGAITNIYSSLPQDFQSQRMFFDIIIRSITKNSAPNEFAAELKSLCSQLIKNARKDAVKTAIIHVLISDTLFDTKSLFEQDCPIMATIKNIKSDECKKELIKLIPTIKTSSDGQEFQIIQELYQWAIDALSTIKDEQSKIEIIKQIIHIITPEDTRVQALFKNYYSWANTAIIDLHDESKKASLILDTLSQASCGTNQNNKHAIGILTTLVTKTLPSIHQDSLRIKIMTEFANKFPCKYEHLKELYKHVYDWLAEQLPLITDEKAKTRLINQLLDRVAVVKTQEQELYDTIYKAIEKGVRSIHDAHYKTELIQAILAKPLDEQINNKTLYATIYQWIEKNIPDIKDATLRETLLLQLLQATKKLNAPNPATHEGQLHQKPLS